MDIATGVLAGNLITVWFVWGAYHFSKRDEKDVPWPAYGAVLVPLGIAIASIALDQSKPDVSKMSDEEFKEFLESY